MLTCEQVCRFLCLPVCAETLRTLLKERGIVAYPAVQKPPIKAHHAQVRLE